MDQTSVFVFLFEINHRKECYGTLEYSSLTTYDEPKNLNDEQGKQKDGNLESKNFHDVFEISSSVDAESMNLSRIHVKSSIGDAESITCSSKILSDQSNSVNEIVFTRSNSNETLQKCSPSLSQVFNENVLLIHADEDICILCRILVEAQKMNSKV